MKMLNTDITLLFFKCVCFFRSHFIWLVSNTFCFVCLCRKCISKAWFRSTDYSQRSSWEFLTSTESFRISDIATQERSIYLGSQKMQLMNWPFLKLAKIASQDFIFFFKQS